MNKFRNNINVLKLLFRNNLKAQLQNRTNIIIRLCSIFAELIIILLFYKFLFYKITAINNWNYEKVLILLFTYDIIKNVLLGLSIRNFSKLEDILLEGKLDLFVTKPISSQFYLSFYYLSLPHLLQAFISLLILFYMINNTIITIISLNILLYIVSLINSIVIGYNLWVMVMSLSFYIIKIKSLHEVFLEVLQLSRLPYIIYPKYVILIFKFTFPVIIITTLPVEILLSISSMSGILFLFLTSIITLITSHLVWQKGIKSYESAGG